jgi:sugar transferase (PEP-CTERM/EpsH1 system associated)
MAMKNSRPLIAHVVFRFGVGGLENGIVNLINHLPRNRWRHAIVSLTDVSQDFVGRVTCPDVCYVAIGKDPGHLVREYPRLMREFRKLRPAIVHTRNLAALEAVLPARAAGIPIRIHGEHGWDVQDPEGRRRRYRLVRRFYRPLVNHYVALSRHLADYLRLQVRVPDASISQIYNGVDTARFHPVAEVRASIPGCPFRDPDHWLIGSVGRLEAIKDPITLARGFVHALRIEPGAARRLRLIFVGDGALRRQAEAVLAEAGARELVWFAGERADVPQVMQGLDCFLLPSAAEGVSNTILEAMATRLPVIATRVGGNSELIESGMSGTLVPSGRPDALAEAIVGYYKDRSTARRHAKAAYGVVQTRFSLATMVAAYARVYERMLVTAGLPLPVSESGQGSALDSPKQTSLQSVSHH